MSFQAMTWAVEQRLPANQKIVLLMLANRTNHETGMCVPRIKVLAEECGMSETACKTALRNLADAGLIRVESRFEGGVQKPNQYHLMMGVGQNPTHPNTMQGGGSESAGVGRNPPGGGSESAPGVGRNPPTEPGSYKPGSKPKDNSAPPEFAEAWAAYPKRAGGNSKADALKAWKARIAAGVEPSRMIEGVKRYAAFCQATNRIGTEYVKQAATFFGPALHFDEDWAAPAPTRPNGRPSMNDMMGAPRSFDDVFGEMPA